MALHKRKGSPFWWYDFTVNGRRFRGSCKTNDRKTAKAIEAKLNADAVLGIMLGARPRITLNATLGRYWQDHAQHLRSGHQAVKYHARHYLRHFGKDTFLHEITDDDVSRYVAKRRGMVSNSTVNREVKVLRSIFRMARYSWKVDISEMPDFRRHMLPEPAARDRYLTPDEAKRLIDSAVDHLEGPIRCALYTGLRLGNVVGLDWSQINLDRREIAVKVKDLKPGGKVHVIPIVESLFVMFVNMGQKERGPVFTYRGKPIKKFRRSFKTACRKAGIEDFRFHDLRHTCASWLVQAGIPLDVVQDILGHHDITMTRRYAHRATDAKRKALEAVFDGTIQAQSNSQELANVA